eukprot:m.148544 g.148544  ORF g.148544 m.148544 type:complete len:1484 (+) comp14187_c0_seq2:78-4529(+)
MASFGDDHTDGHGVEHSMPRQLSVVHEVSESTLDDPDDRCFTDGTGGTGDSDDDDEVDEVGAEAEDVLASSHNSTSSGTFVKRFASTHANNHIPCAQGHSVSFDNAPLHTTNGSTNGTLDGGKIEPSPSTPPPTPLSPTQTSSKRKSKKKLERATLQASSILNTPTPPPQPTQHHQQQRRKLSPSPSSAPVIGRSAQTADDIKNGSLKVGRLSGVDISGSVDPLSLSSTIISTKTHEPILLEETKQKKSKKLLGLDLPHAPKQLVRYVDLINIRSEEEVKDKKENSMPYPYLHSNELEQDERTLRFELFYDLIFVAAILKLGDFVKPNVSLQRVGQSLLFFTILWNDWFHVTMFYSRVGVPFPWNVLDILNLVSSLAVAIHVAQTSFTELHVIGEPGNLGGVFDLHEGGMVLVVDSLTNFFGDGLIISVIASRAITIFCYALTAYFQKAARAMALIYTIAMALSIILFGISFYTYKNNGWGLEQLAYLWVPALSIELLMYPLAGLVKAARVRLNILHHIERHSLWVVLILGESLISMVIPILSCTCEEQSYISILFNIILVYNIYQMYMDVQPSLPDEPHALHGRFSMLTGWLWCILHCFLTFNIFLIGVGTKLLVAHVIDNQYDSAYASLLCYSFFATTICLALQRCTHGNFLKGPRYTYLIWFVFPAITALGLLIPSHITSLHFPDLAPDILQPILEHLSHDPNVQFQDLVQAIYNAGVEVVTSGTASHGHASASGGGVTTAAPGVGDHATTVSAFTPLAVISTLTGLSALVRIAETFFVVWYVPDVMEDEADAEQEQTEDGVERPAQRRPVRRRHMPTSFSIISGRKLRRQQSSINLRHLALSHSLEHPSLDQIDEEEQDVGVQRRHRHQRSHHADRDTRLSAIFASFGEFDGDHHFIRRHNAWGRRPTKRPTRHRPLRKHPHSSQHPTIEELIREYGSSALTDPEQLIPILRRQEAISHLTEAQAIRLLQMFELRKCQPGDVLYRKGERPFFHIIGAGLFEVSVQLTESSPKQISGEVAIGSCVGSFNEADVAQHTVTCRQRGFAWLFRLTRQEICNLVGEQVLCTANVRRTVSASELGEAPSSGIQPRTEEPKPKAHDTIKRVATWSHHAFQLDMASEIKRKASVGVKQRTVSLTEKPVFELGKRNIPPRSRALDHQQQFLMYGHDEEHEYDEDEEDEVSGSGIVAQSALNDPSLRSIRGSFAQDIPQQSFASEVSSMETRVFTPSPFTNVFAGSSAHDMTGYATEESHEDGDESDTDTTSLGASTSTMATSVGGTSRVGSTVPGGSAARPDSALLLPVSRRLASVSSTKTSSTRASSRASRKSTARTTPPLPPAAMRTQRAVSATSGLPPGQDQTHHIPITVESVAAFSIGPIDVDEASWESIYSHQHDCPEAEHDHHVQDEDTSTSHSTANTAFSLALKGEGLGKEGVDKRGVQAVCGHHSSSDPIVQLAMLSQPHHPSIPRVSLHHHRRDESSFV